jgi:hypothetical protein
MFLSSYEKFTNVLSVSFLSQDRYQYDSLILSKQHILVNTCNSCCDVKGADVVLTSQKNAWKQILIFPLRYYANCVSTTLTVLITLKVFTSFIVTLYLSRSGITCLKFSKELQNSDFLNRVLYYKLTRELMKQWLRIFHRHSFFS